MNRTNGDVEQVIATLKGSVEDRIAAARTVKNAVVGNPTKKRLFIAHGAVSQLTDCVKDVTLHPVLATQAVSALGSLSVFFSSATITDVAPVLVRCLFSSEPGPVKAAARALKLVTSSKAFRSSKLSTSLATEDVAARLVYLLKSFDDSMSEVCTVIISQSCVGTREAQVFDSASAVDALVRLLWSTKHERCVVACLNAFSALSRHSRSISRCLAQVHGLVPLAMPLTRSQSHLLRLAACRLLTIFHTAGLLATGFEGTVSNALVNLLVAPHRSTQTTTALTLAELVRGSVRLQSIAAEAGAVLKLAAIIFAASGTNVVNPVAEEGHIQEGEGGLRSDRDALMASAFTALAAVSSELDSARDTIILYDLLPHVLEALSRGDVDIVLSALKCIQSLGRSVKIVRRDLSNESIGRTLLNLLSSENEEIRRYTSATLCNLVLEFSPVRNVVLEGGGPDILVEMLRSADDDLRTNALWALKNLLFKADVETKRVIMSRLSYKKLQLLCADVHPRVRELAMTIVRNLACSGSTHEKNAEVDALFAATGNGFVSILSDALKIDSTNLDIAVQALYVVCNIASGTEHHKERLMRSDIPMLILQWTSHRDERARIAAVWCTINLSWKDGRWATQTPQARGQSAGSRARRLEMLRRQHLPSPSTALERNFLENPTFSRRNDVINNVHTLNSSIVEDRESTSNEKGYNHAICRSLSHNPLREEYCDGAVIQRANNSGYEWRMERLRELGFEGRLRMLVNDPHIEVQGRARAALELFDCEDVHPLDCNPSSLLDYNPTPIRLSESPQSPPILLRGTGSDSSLGGSST